MDEVIQIKGLNKTYGKGETAVQALKSISISIKRGDFVAIIGPSGSGKSTLLHMIGGLDTPTQGKVLLDNEDIYKMDDTHLSILRRRRLGFVFQSYNLVPVLTVYENVLLPVLLEGKAWDQGYIDEIVKLLGIEKRLSHLPGALSGGQQQRVAVARALANKPAVILADEPTGNLDTKTGKEVLELLRIVQRMYHQTLIIVTHDMAIARTADRIITIKDGLVAEDTERSGV